VLKTCGGEYTKHRARAYTLLLLLLVLVSSDPLRVVVALLSTALAKESAGTLAGTLDSATVAAER